MPKTSPHDLIGKIKDFSRIVKICETDGKCVNTTLKVECISCGANRVTSYNSWSASTAKNGCRVCSYKKRSYPPAANRKEVKPGDMVGNSKLIKELTPRKEAQGMVRRGLFKCPRCCSEFESGINTERATNRKYCQTCKGSKKSFNRLELREGDVVGNGFIYLRDAGQRRKPSGQVVRHATFICPVCDDEHTTTLNTVTSGKAKSCGCQRWLGTDTINGFVDQSGRFALKEEVHVYLYSFEVDGERHFKVGITNNMKARRQNLQKPSQGVGVPITLEWESVFGSRTEAFAVEWNALAEARAAYSSSAGSIDYFEGAMECFVGDAEYFIPTLDYLKDRLEEIGPTCLVLESRASLSKAVKNKLESVSGKLT